MVSLNDVDIFVLNPVQSNLPENAFKTLKILGKTCIEWLKFSLDGNNFDVLDFSGQNLLQFIKPHLKQKPYTLILYANAPLINISVIETMLNYFEAKQLNAFENVYGWLLSTQHAKTANMLFSEAVQNFEQDNFLKIQNFEDVASAIKMLQHRINAFHMQNQVYIISPPQTFIEAEVEIGSGTTIYPNNYLLGTTNIGQNCIIYPNNIINSKKITENQIVKAGQFK